jgi:hypothetical protein
VEPSVCHLHSPWHNDGTRRSRSPRDKGIANRARYLCTPEAR